MLQPILELNIVAHDELLSLSPSTIARLKRRWIPRYSRPLSPVASLLRLRHGGEQEENSENHQMDRPLQNGGATGGQCGRADEEGEKQERHPFGVEAERQLAREPFRVAEAFAPQRRKGAVRLEEA
jgi:hypothetical protein